MNLLEMIERDRDSIIEQWLNDLESGKYTQTYGVLCRTEEDVFGHSADPNIELIAKPGHCCLGVLADQLSHRYPKSVWWLDDEDGRREIEFGNISTPGYDSTTDLPFDVWKALNRTTHRVIGKKSMGYLASELNDKGVSFIKIAAHIREHIQHATETVSDTSSTVGDEELVWLVAD